MKYTVWVISQEVPPEIEGGLGTHIYTLVRGLRARDISVKVISLKETRAFSASYSDVLDCELFVIPVNHIAQGIEKNQLCGVDGESIPYIQSVIDNFIVKSENPVIHAHDNAAFIFADYIRRKVDIPVISTLHLPVLYALNESDLLKMEYSEIYELATVALSESRNVETSSLAKGVVTEVLNIKRSDHVIHVSEGSKTYYQEMYGVGEDASIVHNSYDEELLRLVRESIYLEGDQEYTDITKEFFDAPIVIGASGRITKQKGFDHLVRAFRLVLDEYPNAKLVIAGGNRKKEEDIETDKFQNKYADLAMSQSLIMLGFLDKREMSDFITHIDVAVIPSIYEPFGIVALDFLMGDAPIVYSDVGGLPEILEGEQLSSAIPVTDDVPDIGMLAARIIDYIEMSEIEKAKRLESRAEHLKRFAPEKFLDKTVEIYEGLVRG